MNNKNRIFSEKGKVFNILQYIIFTLFFIFSIQFLGAQEKQDQTPPEEKTEEEKYREYMENYKKQQNVIMATAWGILPGGGQIYNKNYLAGATQTALFLSFWGIGRDNANRPEYIAPEDRYVDFDLVDMFMASELDRLNLLYTDIPLFTESRWNRDYRLYRAQKLGEVNPLIQYGSYSRLNYASANVDLASISAQDSIFYSVYSGYRDAGGISDSFKEENFIDLATAPFRPKYLIDPYVFAPLLALAAYGASTPPEGPWTLVSPGMKSSGYMGFYVATISFNAGVTEEAFFRGFLNHSMSQSLGPFMGGVVSGSIFGFAHYQGGSLLSVWPQLMFGYYTAYLHHKYNWDIKRGIALHFWWDVIALALEIARYKEDANVDKNQQQVHFMPITYQMQF